MEPDIAQTPGGPLNFLLKVNVEFCINNHIFDDLQLNHVPT